MRRKEERVTALEELGERLRWLRNIVTECGDPKSDGEIRFECELKSALVHAKNLSRLCDMTIEF